MISIVYKKIQNELSLRRKIKSLFWLQRLKYFGLVNVKCSIENNDKLAISSLGIELKHDQDFFLEGYNYASQLIEVGTKFKVDSTGGILAVINNHDFIVESKQDLFILKEVYYEKCYNFLFETSSVVLDIGFNVGFSSLFFAQNPNVTRIFGFEPFPTTYNSGLANLKNNPKLSEKISVHNYGLAGQDSIIESTFDFDKKGNNSATPVATEILNSTTEKIELRDISKVFDELKVFKENQKIVLKMDCEGGEYELIEKLDKDGLLEKIDIIMVEWHKNGAQPLEDILVRNKFKMFSVQSSSYLGFIYAIK